MSKERKIKNSISLNSKNSVLKHKTCRLIVKTFLLDTFLIKQIYKCLKSRRQQAQLLPQLYRILTVQLFKKESLNIRYGLFVNRRKTLTMFSIIKESGILKSG